MEDFFASLGSLIPIIIQGAMLVGVVIGSVCGYIRLSMVARDWLPKPPYKAQFITDGEATFESVSDWLTEALPVLADERNPIIRFFMLRHIKRQYQMSYEIAGEVQALAASHAKHLLELRKEHLQVAMALQKTREVMRLPPAE